MRYSLLTVLSAGLAFAPCLRANIDPRNFDTGAKPQLDFYEFANGGWIKANPVPAAYSTWGAFNEVDERNKIALHQILENAAGKDGRRTQIEQQVGDFYASGMDESAIETAGMTPLQSELERIAKIATVTDVQAVIARLHTVKVNAGFFFTSEQDPKNSVMMIAAGAQAGLGMPDRDYYFRDDEKSKLLREQYVAHVARMLELAGDPPAATRAEAQKVMALETALAQGSKKRVDLRDPVANYHKMPQADLQTLTPHFDWNAYFAGVGLAQPGDIDVGQPEFFSAFDAALCATPVADWRAYLRWHLIHAEAPYLSAVFVNENFDFYGHKLTGRQQLRDRWKRVLDTVDGSIGEALGQLYVAGCFPPESKTRMLKLVGNLRAALRDRIQTVEWMDEPTRAAALKKLDAFGVKIGYPDKWIDYSRLAVDRGPFVLNVLRADEFNFQRELAKIGKPMDRTEWDMTPPTVNAYYNPTMNEIVFPAGILQPPFFDAHADDAVNYGGIGAVIGHEMTHGFDDEGRQYDAQGNLTDWWSPDSAARFKERSQAIINQFNAYVPIDDLHINGELTQGENIADLGGVKIAYSALQKALAGQPRTAVLGYTPQQRFFLSWATVWHESMRPEAARLQVNTDPHSAPQFRVNGPLSNLAEFAAAFDVPEGALMRRPPAARVLIW
jgi:predicted metalloendopeptidase